MNITTFKSIQNVGNIASYSRSLADLSSLPSISDKSAILLSGNLYGESITLPQNGMNTIRSLLYSFRPLFNLASTAPPNDGFSKTATPSYNDLPMVILFNQTTGQLIYIGGGNTTYSPDDQTSAYSAAPAMLSVQGCRPFFANISDSLQLYSIQNQNSVARPIGYINLLFADFDIETWGDTQGSFYNALTA